MAFWREPTAEEQAVLSLAEISDGLDDFEQAYSEVLFDFQDKAAELIAAWVKAGKLDPANLTDSKTLESFPYRKELHAELVKLLQGMAEFGKQQLEAELARQSKELNRS